MASSLNNSTLTITVVWSILSHLANIDIPWIGWSGFWASMFLKILSVTSDSLLDRNLYISDQNLRNENSHLWHLCFITPSNSNASDFHNRFLDWSQVPFFILVILLNETQFFTPKFKLIFLSNILYQCFSTSVPLSIGVT